MLAIGGFGGMAAAPIIGGWAADTMGWRSAFFILGPVSLLLLPLAFFVLRDPSSVENMNTLGSEREHIERESAFVLLKNPSFLRSEEHTSELQSLMRISYAVFCLKK